jgi:hypothetical protein
VALLIAAIVAPLGVAHVASAQESATPATTPPAGKPKGNRRGTRAAPVAKPKPGAKPKPAPVETAKPEVSTGGGPTAHEVVTRESHIEFDERMVKGQTAAGAIYLFQRAPTEFKSIVHVPDSFRDRTTRLLALRRSPP